jgi:hypothetical protein
MKLRGEEDESMGRGRKVAKEISKTGGRFNRVALCINRYGWKGSREITGLKRIYRR